MRSFGWRRKYLDHLKSFYTKATVGETHAKLLRFAFGGRQWLDSTMGAAIPIWANVTFRPARVRLIRGKTELLSGMGIICKHGITVRFGRDQFNVG